MRVEAVFELDNVRVIHHFHDLKLPVLEALVLKDLLNGHLRPDNKLRSTSYDDSADSLKRTVSPVSKHVA